MTRKPGVSSKETRKHLVDAATKEFAKSGYAKASLRDICARANITTGALYFFFGGKDDLFRTVIEPITTSIKQSVSERYVFDFYGMSIRDEQHVSHTTEAIADLNKSLSKHKNVCKILLDDFDHPAVAEFRTELEALMRKKTDQLMYELYTPAPPEQTPSDQFCQWLINTHIDVVRNMLNEVVEAKGDVTETLRVLKFMHGGVATLVDEDIERGIVDGARAQRMRATALAEK